MKLPKLWKIGAGAALVGVVALVATACAGTTTVTAPAQTVTLPPQTVTAAPKALILQSDAVIGAAGANNPADICVQSSKFTPGEDVVWRIKIYDPVTGNPMDDKALNSVVVSLKDGQTFNAKYGGHPGGPGATPTDFFWSTAWAIPASYPTGSVPYTVAAKSNDGRTGTFDEFNVGPSLLTVVAAQPPVAQKLTVDANTVIGGVGVKNPADICVGSSRFQQGETVVWQIKVYDPTMGNLMDDKALKSVVVSLKDGQTFDARYGAHPAAPPDQPQPPPTDYFWTGAWTVPAAYPTGSVPFTVTATGNDGRTGTFSEFNVAPSLLMVVAAQ